MLAVHTFVHHKFKRHGRAFIWFNGHRTDGRGGRSTPLLDFNVGILCEMQGTVTCVGKLERNLDRITQFLVA